LLQDGDIATVSVMRPGRVRGSTSADCTHWRHQTARSAPSRAKLCVRAAERELDLLRERVVAGEAVVDVEADAAVEVLRDGKPQERDASCHRAPVPG